MFFNVLIFLFFLEKFIIKKEGHDSGLMDTSGPLWSDPSMSNLNLNDSNFVRASGVGSTRSGDPTPSTSHSSSCSFSFGSLQKNVPSYGSERSLSNLSNVSGSSFSFSQSGTNSSNSRQLNLKHVSSKDDFYRFPKKFASRKNAVHICLKKFNQQITDTCRRFKNETPSNSQLETAACQLRLEASAVDEALDNLKNEWDEMYANLIDKYNKSLEQVTETNIADFSRFLRRP